MLLLTIRKLIFRWRRTFPFSNKPISVSFSHKPISVSGLLTQPSPTQPSHPSQPNHSPRAQPQPSPAPSLGNGNRGHRLGAAGCQLTFRASASSQQAKEPFSLSQDGDAGKRKHPCVRLQRCSAADGQLTVHQSFLVCCVQVYTGFVLSCGSSDVWVVLYSSSCRMHMAGWLSLMTDLVPVFFEGVPLAIIITLPWTLDLVCTAIETQPLRDCPLCDGTKCQSLAISRTFLLLPFAILCSCLRFVLTFAGGPSDGVAP